MAEKKYMLFDFGASHGRCLVVKFDGKRITMEEIHEFNNTPVNYAGTLYWDILYLVNELKIGIKKAYAAHPDVSSIGLDTWGCDFGFIDKYGTLLGNPVNYRNDARLRHKKECDAFLGDYELFKLGGANLNHIMSVYELFANLKEDTTLLKAADKLLMMPDLLNYYLTGIPVNEYTNATMTLMVDQNNKIWEKKIINGLELPEKIFGKILMPGTKIGVIQKRISDELGVPQLPVIAVATHDTASAIAGIPLTDREDWAFLSLGTWAIIGVECDRVITEERAYREDFGNQGGCEGKNNFVNLFTGLWVIQQCYERWNNEAGKQISWNAVVDAVKDARGGIAFVNLDAEEFVPPSPNMPAVLQEYCKKRGFAVPQGMGEVARCVYESFVLKLKKNCEEMKSLAKTEVKVLYTVGGGSKNGLLCQWIADALKVKVKAGPAETTSVGNVLLQMKGLGEIASLAEGRIISAQSAQTEEYNVRDTQKWNEYYEICQKTKIWER
jgi:sugar (pentulose or hexulose) kinase